MKEILKEYYGINVRDVNDYEGGLVFFVGGDQYYLFKTKLEEVSFVESVSEYIMNLYGIKLHSIVKNRYNEIFSNGYVLLKLNVLIESVDDYDINLFSNCIMNDFNNDFVSIREIWEGKIDYYCELIKDSKYNSIRYLCDYYFIISEMLLKFIDSIDFRKFDVVLSHKKDYKNTIDFYNPFNLTRDFINIDLINCYVQQDRVDELVSYYSGYIDRQKYLFFKLVFPYEFYEMLEDSINGMDCNVLLSMDVIKYEETFDKYQELFGFYLLPIKKSN